jgi:calcineurin-like phosphoesterase family protein
MLMMSDIWVLSDTHFSHANILKFTDRHSGKPVRPFHSVQDMNEIMMENWNSVVKPVDKVYHLGDVFFGSKEDFKVLWPKLNGRKRLIVGNHDDVKFLSSGAFFEKVMLWRKFEHLLFTHVPVHPSTLQESRFDKQMINVHGHIHQNKSPDGPYKCVCVEQPDVMYKPVHIEELLSA